MDTAFIGHLGARSLGALSVSVSIFNSFFWIFNFLIHIPMESVSKGKELGEGAQLVQAKVGLFVSILVGALSFCILYFFSIPILKIAGAQPETFELAKEYFIIRVIGQPFLLIYFCLLSILRGVGRARASLFPVCSSVFMNILMTYIFIYHFDYGLKGAALGTVISYIVGLIITIYLLLKDFGLELFSLRDIPPIDSFSHFSNKSLFLFIRSLCLTSIFFISTKIAAEIGLYAISAYQIAIQFWLFSSYFLDGLAMVGNIETAKLCVNRSKKEFFDFSSKLFQLSVLVGLAFTLIYFLFSKFLFSMFTTDQKIIELLSQIWPIVLGGQVINSLAFSIDGVYFGLGGHKRLAKMMILNILLIFIPIASVSLSLGSLKILIFSLLLTSIFRWFFLKRFLHIDFSKEVV